MTSSPYLRVLNEAPGGDRRSFLSQLGASVALAGLGAGCRDRFPERILPYSRQPPEVTPGISNHYATAMTIGGYATGLIVEAREGRPIKVEGNPEHPASLGATSAQHQASLAQLYDPSRASSLREGDRPSSWASFVRSFRRAGDDGAGMFVVLEPTGSPMLAELLGRLREALPRVEVCFWDPLAGDGEVEASRALYGEVLGRHLDLTRADVVVDLDADLAHKHPFALRYLRQLSVRRRPGPDGRMSRVYSVAPCLTVTGGAADHHLPVSGSKVLAVAAAMTAALLEADPARGPRGSGPASPPQRPVRWPEGQGLGEGVVARLLPLLRRLANELTPEERAFASAAAADLAMSAGRAVIAAGPRQPAAVHALSALLHRALGVNGSVAWLARPSILELGEPSHGLARVGAALAAGQVDRLIVLGANPALTAPADLRFSTHARSVRLSAELAHWEGEGRECCRWHLPAAHELESWGDTRAYDGTISVAQPLIEPLTNGKSVAEVLALLVGERRALRELIAARYSRGPSEQGPARSEDPELREILRRGLVEGSAHPPVSVELDAVALVEVLETAVRRRPLPAPMELALDADEKMRDGTFTPNLWLLELPDPLTKLTWSNAASIAPLLARELGLETGDWVRLDANGMSVETPVIIAPGHAARSLTLPLGWGRRVEGAASLVGSDAYRLRTSAAPWFTRVEVSPLDRPRKELAITSPHWSMEGREIATSKTLEAFLGAPRSGAQAEELPTLRAAWPEPGASWAMVVDLAACVGCSACVVACQAENNTPVVGEINVVKSREMHWLRIDRYFSGPLDNPEVVTQPMLCQHCEHAPCEYVCPVGATVHSHDGLNDMVYNRCVGTRFCSNNCPYKVRRFNWFDFHEERFGAAGVRLPPASELERLVMNPDVTVRERGVMEKCTFCVQRIRRAGIESRVRGTPLRDGEVVTACQQACPAQAITFGDQNDPSSAVRAAQEDPRVYAALGELGTRPRVRYLSRITNPNPELSHRPSPEGTTQAHPVKP